MARKPLLTEAEIRSFMKLANLSPIGDVKLHEMGYGPDIPVAEEDEEDEDLEVTAPMGAVDDAGLDEPMPVDDVPVDDIEDVPLDDMGDETAELGDGDIEDQFMDLVTQLADLLQIEVDMTNQGEGPEIEDDEPVEPADPALDEPLPDPGEPEGGDVAMADVDDEEEDELPGSMGVYENKEAIVNEVTKRVALRLKAENSKKELAEELTEKIFNRLVKNG